MNKYIYIIFLSACALLIFHSCKKDPSLVQGGYYDFDYGYFPNPAIPTDNPLTVEGVKLGRMLFYETALSRTNTQSCASCHKQEFAFSDTNKFSFGVSGQLGNRQAMSVVNMAWNSNGFFWDGRSDSLRHQALLPIEDPLEMEEDLLNVIQKLQAKPIYVNQFRRTFNTEEITPRLMSFALEQFMNSIVSNRSKFDKVLAGEATLTTNEERGRFLYFNEFNPFFPAQSGADCRHCHGGDNFENDRYMNNGLDTDAEFTDLGLEGATGNVLDRAKFKVPTLRNIELTPPYMHDGRFQTLEEVVDHYDSGMDSSSTLEGHFNQILPTGLQLTAQDKADLISFLKTLTDQELLNDERYSNPF